jgi:hypothetical protein
MLPRRMTRSLCTDTGKKKYRRYFEARAAADDIARTSRENHGRPYQCEHCGDWHLGRSSP